MAVVVVAVVADRPLQAARAASLMVEPSRRVRCAIASCRQSSPEISPFRSRQGTAYSINGRIDVGVDCGGDASTCAGTYGGLTIEPGVRLYGSSGLDYIVVNRGSQIFAVGTPSSPIVFTSRQGIEGTAGIDSIGQWGGLVILGRANITNCGGATPSAIYGTPACQATVEGTAALYGGNSNTDNSGSLRYVRVQHSGSSSYRTRN